MPFSHAFEDACNNSYAQSDWDRNKISLPVDLWRVRKYVYTLKIERGARRISIDDRVFGRHDTMAPSFVRSNRAFAFV